MVELIVLIIKQRMRLLEVSESILTTNMYDKSNVKTLIFNFNLKFHIGRALE